MGSRFGHWQRLLLGLRRQSASETLEPHRLRRPLWNLQGVRSVAHAVAINPVAVIIPCHIIVPKEATDRAAAIRSAARETTLFKGADLYLLDTVDVGDYAWGPRVKREMIKRSLMA